MGTLFIVVIVGLLLYLVFRVITNSNVTVTEEGFSQAGVSVNFKTRKINIKGRTYDVDAVRGLTYRRISAFGTEVQIKVDDFKKPIHNVGVMGLGNEGEKFVQRLETAIRKADGPDFI